MEDPDTPTSRPPPPPPKRLSRPKITLQIPESNVATTPKTPSQKPRAPQPAMYWAPGPIRYHGKPPGTAGSHLSDPHGNPYFNPFMHMYHNKASDFMFKQFEGVKDFTMMTAKSGLSMGEKSAFWFYNKLRTWSRKWFTHLFLSLCLVLYSVMGAALFQTLEGE